MTQTTHYRFKLGRTARSFDPRVPCLSALLAGKTTPPPPPAVDYTEKMPADFGMMLNDSLGDCTCAAYYHARQIWTFHSNGNEITEPNVDVQQMYVEACGYNPAVGGEGPGGNEQHVLTYLQQTGAPLGPQGQQRDKILGFVEVDPRNIDDVKRTIYNSGVAYIGFNVPGNILPPDGSPPQTWTVDPSNQQMLGGHAVVLPGYDANGAIVISWGAKYVMTWEFFSKYVDEVYAITDAAWVHTVSPTLPADLSVDELAAQMHFLEADSIAPHDVPISTHNGVLVGTS